MLNLQGKINDNKMKCMD